MQYAPRDCYVDIVLDIIAGMSTALDSSFVAQAVAALFKFEEKKQTDAGKQSLVGYYAKPIIAQIQLKEVLKKGLVPFFQSFVCPSIVQCAAIVSLIFLQINLFLIPMLDLKN